MMTNKIFGAGLLVATLMAASTTYASTVCTGTLVGTTCTLEGTNIKWIYDVNKDAAALTWFDAPTLIGDSIRFLPTAFRAESLNGAGTVTASANFIFDHVISKNGSNILAISSVDFGDYSILGGNRVSADLYLQAVNQTDPLGLVSQVTNFNTNVATGGVATPWSLSNTLTTIGGPSPSPFHTLNSAVDLTVNIQDTLSATTSASGQDAWIQKKIQLDALTVSPVPVPASVWLLGSALGGLAFMRRRKAQV
jgi:hypothetical protein